MKTLKNLTLSGLLALFVVASAFGQTTTTQTTLSAAMLNTDQVMNVASNTGFTARGALQQDVTLAFVDKELMEVTTVNSTVIGVIRGAAGTPVTPHASGAVVWVGPASNGPFITSGIGANLTGLSGSCTAANQPYLPVIAVGSGLVMTCPSSGPQSGYWTIQQFVPAFTQIKQAWIPCVASVSGNSTGTNNYTTVGTNAVAVWNAQTSGSGTNTHTYVCIFRPAFSTATNHGITVTKATFAYGVQTTGLGTQATTGSSGTLNSVQVFNLITFPASGNSESASSNTLTRADAGTLVFTPTAANFNVATTTAGTFYTETFTPATPFTYNADLQQLQVDVALLNTATSATITNSPGMLIYYSDSN